MTKNRRIFYRSGHLAVSRTDDDGASCSCHFAIIAEELDVIRRIDDVLGAQHRYAVRRIDLIADTGNYDSTLCIILERIFQRILQSFGRSAALFRGLDVSQ